MIKRIKFTLCILLFANCLFSQNDSIKSQILQHEDSKSTIISKGRRLLLDKLIEGDLNKVREIKDYLVKTEDDDYFAFYPSEYWLILYWTKDYNELKDDLQKYNDKRINSLKKRIHPSSDLLYDKLKEKSILNEPQIKKQIQNAQLDAETREFLTLTLDQLLIENGNNRFAQDTINDRADQFLKAYDSGKYEEFTKKYIRYKLVPKNWGMVFEFFSGYSIYNGNLGKTYTNNVPVGVAFDVCYKKLELYLRDYIGFNKTKKDFSYSLGTWEKGSRTMVFLPEISLGYVICNNNRIKLSPFAGIGSMDISPPTNDTEKMPELKEVSLVFTTTYVGGVNLDIKFGPKHTPAFRPKTSYTFMRIRYGYCMPQFANKYEGMTGNMHYITVGFGGMGRGLKRQY